MRALQVSDTTTFELFFNPLLNDGEVIDSVTSVAASPTTITLANEAVNGTADGLTVDVSAGVAETFYEITATIATDTPRTLIGKMWVKVVADGDLMPMPKLIEVWNDFRIEMDDTHENKSRYFWQDNDNGLLWKNTEIVRLWNEASAEFCRRLPIKDRSTTPLVSIATVADQQLYRYSPKIQYIEKITLSSTGQPLIKASAAEMDYCLSQWRTTTGTPQYYVEDDQEPYAIMLYPTPDAVDTLTLTVGRLPLETVTWDMRHTYFVEPDIQYRETLIQGMKALAFKKRDTDTFSENEADRAEQSFSLMAGPRRTAEQIRIRRLMAGRKATATPRPY
jgi:hypothetical protein